MNSAERFSPVKFRGGLVFFVMRSDQLKSLCSVGLRPELGLRENIYSTY